MLSFEEMYSGFHLLKKGQIDKQKIRELFDEIDINGSGVVDFNGIDILTRIYCCQLK